MFGINTSAVKSAFAGFEKDTAALPPASDPWVHAIVAFILTLAKAFGE